ncbi:MAG: ArsR/SmtB family transcription factor [Promethearchaeota archaeon]
MSENKTQFIEFLRILADQTRLDILDLLQHEKKTSLQIQKKLNKSQSTISQHLKALTNKNLIIFKINNVKSYKIKNPKIFKLLVEIGSFVANINKEKLRDLRDLDLDVIDTLS